MRTVNFYRGASTDNSGCTLAEVLDFDDVMMETRHDYIQWLFPLPEASKAVPSSPVLTVEELEVFRTDAEVRASVLRAYIRWVDFLTSTSHWLVPVDHNHLRISRALRFLTLAGFEGEADLLIAVVTEMMARAGHTEFAALPYWKRALASVA